MFYIQILPGSINGKEVKLEAVYVRCLLLFSYSYFLHLTHFLPKTLFAALYSFCNPCQEKNIVLFAIFTFFHFSANVLFNVLNQFNIILARDKAFPSRPARAVLPNPVYSRQHCEECRNLLQALLGECLDPCLQHQ